MDYLFLFPFIVQRPLQNTLFTWSFQSSLVLLRHCFQAAFQSAFYRTEHWKQTEENWQIYSIKRSRYTANKTRAWEIEIIIQAWLQLRAKPVYFGTSNTHDATNVKYKCKWPINSCKIKLTKKRLGGHKLIIEKAKWQSTYFTRISTPVYCKHSYCISSDSKVQ